jgi:predicted DCC family thiol-disulfide oxidoreductase YuxK
MRPSNAMISVFYDGGCGLCSREIAYYKRIAASDRFEWIDISRDQRTLANIGIAYESAMKHLHVEDDDRKIHRGVDAFILIWTHLPYWNVVGRLADIPAVKWLLTKAYDVFAEWRYRRLMAKACGR